MEDIPEKMVDVASNIEFESFNKLLSNVTSYHKA